MGTVPVAIKQDRVDVADAGPREAAVARINLDNAPSRAMINRLEAENADIIDLDLLKLNSK